jgi:F-type H+-transporting ATPase subunit delta
MKPELWRVPLPEFPTKRQGNMLNPESKPAPERNAASFSAASDDATKTRTNSTAADGNATREVTMAAAPTSDTFDVEKRKIAAVYAKALLVAHAKTCKTGSLVEEMDSLIDDVLAPNPVFEQTLASALTPEERKIELLEKVLGGQASPEMMVFLKVIAGHGRLDCLRAVRRELREQYNELKGRVEVEVRVALPIDQKLQDELQEKLRRQLNGEPILKVVEDPSLIGGIVVRVGDTVYDGSVATRLDQARREMIERSVQMIETQRAELVG